MPIITLPKSPPLARPNFRAYKAAPMQSEIAIALIKQLVANGTLDAGDIQAITRHLPDADAHAVKAAWLEGMTTETELHVIDGGKND